MILPALALIGTVVSVYDGDGPIRVQTADGIVKVRLRGIQAPDFESAEPCRNRKPGYVCNDRLATASRDKMRALVMHKRVTIQAEGKSFHRVNAWLTLEDGRDVSCEAIRRGIATRWAKFDPAGRLVGCGR